MTVSIGKLTVDVYTSEPAHGSSVSIVVRDGGTAIYTLEVSPDEADALCEQITDAAHEVREAFREMQGRRALAEERDVEIDRLRAPLSAEERSWIFYEYEERAAEAVIDWAEKRMWTR